jgi:hypothetical protein
VIDQGTNGPLTERNAGIRFKRVAPVTSEVQHPWVQSSSGRIGVLRLGPYPESAAPAEKSQGFLARATRSPTVRVLLTGLAFAFVLKSLD